MAHDSNIEIIPAILAKNITEVREKLKLVEGVADWVHLDVMDGIFVPNTAWNNPADLMRMRLPMKIEMHLMVAKPEEVYLDWIRAGASRIIWHIEINADHGEIAADTRRRGVKAGIALNPETPVTAVERLLPAIDEVLLMANVPGFGGQEFLGETLERIAALRALWPEGTIGVDIGITPETAPRAVRAGANVLIAGSAVFGSKDPVKALEHLREMSFYLNISHTSLSS